MDARFPRQHTLAFVPTWKWLVRQCSRLSHAQLHPSCLRQHCSIRPLLKVCVAACWQRKLYGASGGLGACFFSTAQAAGHPVRMLLLTTPSNPVGICLGKDDIIAAMQWCTTNRVHCIVDECVPSHVVFSCRALCAPCNPVCCYVSVFACARTDRAFRNRMVQDLRQLRVPAGRYC